MRPASADRLQHDLSRHLTPHQIGVRVWTRADASLMVEAWLLAGARVRQSFSLSRHQLPPPMVAEIADLIRTALATGTWPPGPVDHGEGSHAGS